MDTGDRPTGRQLKAQATKARIYDAAWHLIGERGFDQVSVDSICRRAGVAKGAFYHHFRSKGDLIVEGYSLCDRYFEEHVEGRFEAADARGRIVEFAGHQARYAAAMGVDLMRQVYKSQLENGTRFFISGERALPRILRGLAAEGQASGELKPAPEADAIAAFILRLMRGLIYDWCLRGGAYDIEAAARDECDSVMALFMARGR